MATFPFDERKVILRPQTLIMASSAVAFRHKAV